MAAEGEGGAVAAALATDETVEEVRLAGGCHCGDVRFVVRVRGPWPLTLVDCNCTVCTKKAILHLVVAPEDFEAVQGCDEAPESETLALYMFGTNAAKHRFCRRCGIHSFYRARSHPNHFTVNARCLEAFRPEAEHFGLPMPTVLSPLDGRDSYEAAVAELHKAIPK